MISDATIVRTIQRYGRDRPDETALIFTSGGDDDRRLSYGELDRRAGAFAARLRQALPAGSLVLLPMRSDAGSVVAICACLYAGLPCAPVPLPVRNGSLRRLEATAAASRCRAVVVADDATHLIAAVPGIPILREGGGDAEDVPASAFDIPRGQELCLVQYTSGSVSDPKGVMLTHANVLANLEMLRSAFAIAGTDVFVSWLPLFHDMGLAMLLMPLYFGVTGVLMPPLAFLRRPERWLRAAEAYGATITGAPNFAYEACVRRIDDDAPATLALDRLRLAFCGAEPVRMSTMQRFARKFEAAGLRASCLYPCYGMAEAVTFVSGGYLQASIRQTAEPVSCGSPAAGTQVVVVDPEDLSVRPDGETGEIWVSGPHVGAGYLHMPDATRATFCARLPGETGRRFLRTGDLGFLRDGSLSVTGRLKDIIIHRGANIHAADVESTVASCHQGFGELGAAFSWPAGATEEVVLVHEIARGGAGPVAPLDMVEAALDAVATHHGVRLHDLVLVRAGTIPKTSSGKVRREACRELYGTEGLPAVAALRGASALEAETGGTARIT